MDLETLKLLRDFASFSSDLSHRTRLYDYICALIEEKENVVWFTCADKLPSLNEPVIVELINGETFYSVYSGPDEFDVHGPFTRENYRQEWYKFSSKSIKRWKHMKR